MEKKYTVFVSSTYEDLVKERAEVMRALLECDCIPCGMELFPSANEDSWTFIKRIIDECDYYLLIVAGRYGSTNSEGMSYTEMEFRYAEKIGKPIIAFVHANRDEISVGKSCQSDKERRGLEQFMTLVNKRQRKTWRTSGELGALASQGMTRLKRDYPAVGWVKGNTPASEELLVENRNLHKENDDLRQRISLVEAAANTNLAQDDDPITIEYSVRYHVDTDNDTYRNLLWQTTWDELFISCFPSYQTRLERYNIRFNIRDSIQVHCKDEIAGCLMELVSLHGCVGDFSEDESKKRFGIVSLSNETESMILFQFAALQYIEEVVVSEGNKTHFYWSLTEKGRSKLIHAYAIHRSTDSVQAQ